MNLEALQKLAADAPPPVTRVDRALQRHLTKLREAVEARKAHERKRHADFLASQRLRDQFLRDQALGYGMPPTDLALWLMANYTPMRLRNGRLVWLQLFYPINHYPDTPEYAELTQLRASSGLQHLQSIIPYD